jgi:hypothetical protein
LAEEAIQRAILNTKARVRDAAMLQTPIWTGTLLGSFDIATTPRSIVWKWDAKSPEGYSYAKIVEEGRKKGKILLPKTKKAMAFRWPWRGGPMIVRKGPLIQGGFEGRGYAEAVKQYAKQALIEELRAGFLAMQGGF